jgi:hypothetical protein
MKQYTYSEARRSFSKVLEEAEHYGVVRIIRRNGKSYEIMPIQESTSASPLNVEGIHGVNASIDEIVDLIREGRERE